MKKLIIFVAFFMFILSNAQQKTLPENPNNIDWSSQKKNSIDFNVLSMLWGANVGYERILNHEVAVGVSSFYLYKYKGSIPIGGLNYYVAPYARYYFGKKPNMGFFWRE